MNPLRDAELLERARERVDSHPRNLRRLGAVEYRDMVIFEDRATGERRKVPNKFINAVGDSIAFELAEPNNLLEE